MTPAAAENPVPSRPVRSNRIKQVSIANAPMVRPQLALRFCLVVIVLSLGPLLLGLGAFDGCVPHVQGFDWTIAMDQRTAAFAAKIDRPKIVFIGGSNVRFGVDAAGLSRDLHVPVVNYGLHASLGIDVIASRAMEVVRPGDIVVFSPEMTHFRAPGIGHYSDEIRLEFLASHPSPIDPSLQRFPVKPFEMARSRCNRLHMAMDLEIGSALHGLLRRCKLVPADPPPEPSVYDVSALADDGSIAMPRPRCQPLSRWSYSDPPADGKAMDFQRSRGAVGFSLVLDQCIQKHCQLLVMPPIRVQVARFAPSRFAGMEQAWLSYASARGATVLLKSGQTALPNEDGYNTEYHVNDAGEKIMEARLATALAPFAEKLK